MDEFCHTRHWGMTGAFRLAAKKIRGKSRVAGGRIELNKAFVPNTPFDCTPQYDSCLAPTTTPPFSHMYSVSTVVRCFSPSLPESHSPLFHFGCSKFNAAPISIWACEILTFMIPMLDQAHNLLGEFLGYPSPRTL